MGDALQRPMFPGQAISQDETRHSRQEFLLGQDNFLPSRNNIQGKPELSTGEARVTPNLYASGVPLQILQQDENAFEAWRIISGEVIL